MKKANTNRFYKGINTDLSLLDRASDMLCDALNIRITSKGKDGLFAANLKGNTEEFKLSEGFLPIGATEYNGILFILSASTSRQGVGEIGTFPSPRGTSEGFDRVYKPLQNFTYVNPNKLIQDLCDDNFSDLERTNFRSFSLNFSCEHQARVIARIDYDKSVNIYWTDNYNPVRSINTGFHSETGLFNKRVFSEQQVQRGYINLINENQFTPIVKLKSLEEAGNLKAGHYFFFARYTDLSFNTTSFLGMSMAVPAFNEQKVNGGNLAYGKEPQTETNRNALLEITNIDQQSAFLEIGYIYYFGEDSFEIKLIDIRNPINGNSTIEVNVTGDEPTIDLSLDEFITYKPSDALFAKDIGQLNNKMYMANTRGRKIDHPDLRKFFCKMKIGEDSSYSRSVPFAEENSTNSHVYGIDAKDVHEKVGYFSGETYVFAAVPIFQGGFTGLAYPMKGYDNYNGLMANENENGTFRFSSSKVTHFFDNNTAFIKGVTFDTADAKTFFDTSSWLKENVIGFYFTRGERVKNLMYQGLMVGCYKGESLFKKPDQEFQSKKIAGGNATVTRKVNYEKWMPLIEPATPYWYWVHKPGGSPEKPDNPKYQIYPNGEIYGEAADEYAVFSFDYYMDMGRSEVGVPESSYVEKIGVIDDSMWELSAIPAKFRRPPVAVSVLIGPYNIATWSPSQQESIPGFWGKEFVQTDLNNTPSGSDFTSETFNVSSWDYTGKRFNGVNFVSRIHEGDPINQGFFYFEYDRASTDADEYLLSLPVATPAYILLTNVGDLSIPEWRNNLVNIHKIDPNTLDYSRVYDFKNTTFSPIDGFIDVKKIGGVYTIYSGDCFVARTYLKTMNHHDDEVGDNFFKIINHAAQFVDYTDTSQAHTTYTNNNYGTLLSIVTENAYNPNYRYEKGRNGFYPKDLDFTLVKNSPESPFYNLGYTRMLGPRQYLGIDAYAPISDNQFPTRIRHSIPHIFNALRDGYLQFVPGTFKDFDFEYGPINAMLMDGDNLYTFQDDAINLHPINERAVAQSSGTDTPFVLGESRELTEFKRVLSQKYGTQHQWSIVKGESGIYGFDWNKQAFWRVSSQGFENLGLLRQCEKWIDEIVESKKSKYSDIIEQLKDNPVCNLGIHATYDREYKEVLMTFILGNGNDKTICFVEKLNNFSTKYSFTPTFYAQLERDLYSFNSGGFWLHDSNEEYNTFYGQLYPSYVEIVVNHDSEVAKHFDNLIISSNNVEFSKIMYQTQHQEALQDPFLGEFWNKAIYREMQWKLPIRRADSIIDNDLSLGLIKSRLRGRYLIINLEYFQNKKMWLREIITAYTHSKA